MLKNKMDALCEAVKNDSGATLYTDGHSLGGEFAQAAAVYMKCSGYAQDPLSLSDGAQGSVVLNGVSPYSGGLATSFQDKLDAWDASEHFFDIVNLEGDIATAAYAGKDVLFLGPHNIVPSPITFLQRLFAFLVPVVGSAIVAAERHKVGNLIEKIKGGNRRRGLSGRASFQGIRAQTALTDV